MQSLDVSSNRIDHCSDLLPDNLHERSGIVSVTNTVSGLPVGQGEHHRKIAPVVIHIRRRTIKNERHDFRSVFDLTPVGQEGPFGTRIQRWSEEAYVPGGNTSKQQSKQFVFVRVLEIPEHSEKGREFWARSIVRLEKLENCLHRSANHAKLPSLNVPFKISLAVANGEHEFVRMGRGVLTRFSNGDGVDKMIEGAAEIMNAICDHERPSLDWGGSNAAIEVDKGAVACAIKICLVGEAIGFSVTPSLNFILDGFSVFNGAA